MNDTPEHGWEGVAESPTLRGLDEASDRAVLPARPLVLMVDDNADSRELYAEWLQELGCRVLVAHNGLEGLRLARTCVPDLAVVDVCMPVMDGCEMTTHLRSHPRTRAIPVIAVTAFGNAWHEMALAHGCDVVLAKPTMLPDFEELVTRLVHVDRRG